MSDYILNGVGYGSVAKTILAHKNPSPGMFRPFEENGQNWVTLEDGWELGADKKPKRKYKTIPVNNAAATLRRDEWMLFDRAVQDVKKERLTLWSSLVSAGLTRDIPNAMGKTVLQYRNMGDISPATISMDGIRESEQDRPLFDVGNIPIPIIHKDFNFSAREIAISRNDGPGLDTTNIRLATRRVAEEVEKMTIGVSSSFSYGGGTIYGLINHPNRNTHSLTLPTDGSWTPGTLGSEILAMRQKAYDDKMYGPYRLYFSTGWDAYLDEDYSQAKGDNTLRQRIGAIRGITGVETLDLLTGYQVILLSMDSETIQACRGMDIQTLQWESHGGMQMNFKVMCIMFPLVRVDQDENSGIVHGTAA